MLLRKKARIFLRDIEHDRGRNPLGAVIGPLPFPERVRGGDFRVAIGAPPGEEGSVRQNCHQHPYARRQ